MALDDYEAELIHAVRGLPDESRAAVLDAARAVGPEPAAADDATPSEAERRAADLREARALAAEKGLTDEDAEAFVEFWTFEPDPAQAGITGPEMVRLIEAQGPISDEFADELLEIIERECGQIEWSSWDFPLGHKCRGGNDTGEPGRPEPDPGLG